MAAVVGASEHATGYGGLSLVKKDGTHSQRFPLVEKRYLFGRWMHPRAAVLLPPAGQSAVLPQAVLFCRRRRVTGRVPPACARADYCDIRINLLTVSREHAEIVVDEDNQVCGRGRC